MNNSKLISYLGFAIKSGDVIFGYDNLIKCKKLPSFVLICSTQNDKVTNKVITFCDNNKVEYNKLKNIILGELISRDNTKILGICNNNLSSAIKNELENGNNE